MYPPQKVRGGHSILRFQACLSLSVPTRALRRPEYRLKAFVWPAGKASRLAQAQTLKQVAATGNPAIGGGLLQTLK